MKKQNVIIHSFPSWDAPYIKSTIELINEVDDTYNWYFVDYAYTWKDVFTTSYAPIMRILGLVSRVRKVKNRKGTTIKILNLPPLLPSYRIPFSTLKKIIRKLNISFLRFYIRRWLTKFNIERPIIINALNPYYGTKLHSTFKPSYTIYYCYDNIATMPWTKYRYATYETEFVGLADSVLVSSKGLLLKLSKVHNNVSLLHNGMNGQVFYPRKHKTNNTIYIDYLGAIDDRLDYNLLQFLFVRFPNWTFRFTGKVIDKRMAKHLKEKPNVILNRQMDQTQAAEMLSTSSACLIPFVPNAFTHFIYPLKINEYLALGKPVIATPFADLSSFDNVISIGEGSEDFAKHLALAITYDNAVIREKRIHFAQQNTWSHRARTLTEQLNQLKA